MKSIFLFLAAATAVPLASAQVNSTNIVGLNNVLSNTASSAAIVAGNTSTNGGTNSAIIGAANASIPGGTRFAFIGAGNYNTMGAGSHSAAMLGGFSNSLSSGSARAVAVGGAFNTNSARSSALLGGEYNVIGANSTGAATVGGISNQLSSDSSGAVITGGSLNQADAPGAVVPGGYNNQASGTNSFAAGTRAWARHNYAFVWGGSTAVDTLSIGTNSFTARAPGGFTFLTATVAGFGASLPPGAASWEAVCDSNAKTDFQPVDYRRILAKLAALPVTKWHYKHDPNRSYIGPTAQDFRAAFGLGHDDKHIGTLDTDGVALAAIKGLAEEIAEEDRLSSEREARISRLEEALRQLREAKSAGTAPSF